MQRNFIATAFLLAVAHLLCPGAGYAQVYSPKVVLAGQPDTTDLKSLTQTLYANAHATTEREKAEAIWRFLLTDGRFVKPGIFYHIPGWAYEEPMGEVLDPVKLLNSYGFGLCYQDAPLLQALWTAGGFAQTRVWFLTGHTVAEVYYDKQFHYYDSDMMGYTTIGNGPVHQSTVASVQQLADDPNIFLSKLQSPRKVRDGAVDAPWYNADVREAAIGGLAGLFSSRADNHLYSSTRYPQGHAMDFTLRPGERMIRYYNAETDMEKYLPYETDGSQWAEFPKDVGSLLLVSAGPRSEKDDRRWATGRIEYEPSNERATESEQSVKTISRIYKMPSPYVIIRGEFVIAPSAHQDMTLETSTDEGHTWVKAQQISSVESGAMHFVPATISKTRDGSLNAIAGMYSYWVRVTAKSSVGKVPGIPWTALKLSTIFQLNPRTLPALQAGANTLTYSMSKEERHELPVHAESAAKFADRVSGAFYEQTSGQGYWKSKPGETGELVFKLADDRMNGFDAGGRFLNLRGGLAPDKLTAEVRSIKAWPEDADAEQQASLEWSRSTKGPWQVLWRYQVAAEKLADGVAGQTLQWPEVDRKVRDPGAVSGPVYVRYRFRNLAVDDIRLAVVDRAAMSNSGVVITHIWLEGGEEKRLTKEFGGEAGRTYQVQINGSQPVTNIALILSVPPVSR